MRDWLISSVFVLLNGEVLNLWKTIHFELLSPVIPSLPVSLLSQIHIHPGIMPPF